MFIVEFCNKNNYNYCGSDFTRIYRNLKTTRTLKNLKFNGTSKDITHYNIYSVSNVYDRDTYILIEKINL